MQGYKEIKTHPFFEDLDFELVESRELEVPGIDLFLNKCQGLIDSHEGTEDDNSNKLKPCEGGFMMIGGICPSTILKQGKVKKRSKIFFTKRRILYLLNDLKLAFYKLNDRLDEEIYLDQSVQV